MRFGKLDEGINYFQEMIQMDSTSLFNALMARCFNSLAIYYDARANYPSQIHHAQKALQYAERAQDTVQFIDGLVSLCRVHN